MNSPECEAVKIHGDFLTEIPSVRPAVLALYNGLALAALYSKEKEKMKQARYFIEQIHSIDASESLHDKEYVCLDAYQEAALRLGIGEDPMRAIEILSRYQKEEYAEGYGAVLVLKAQAQMKQGEKEAALTILEEAVACDFSDERYATRTEDMFKFHRVLIREEADYGAVVARYRRKIGTSATKEEYCLLLDAVLAKTNGSPEEGERKYANYIFSKAVTYGNSDRLISLASSYSDERNFNASYFILDRMIETTPSRATYTAFAALLRAESSRNEKRAQYYNWKARQTGN